MSDEVQWAHYSDVPEGEEMEDDRFVHFWKPTHEFDSERLDMSVIEMEPGQGGPRHSHEEPIEEYYMVLEGEIDVELEDRTITGETGTIFCFPASAVHRPVNNSSEPALLLSLRALAGADGEAIRE